MSYHIVSIDEADCVISASRGQLVLKADGSTKSIPMEDVAAIVITSFKCVLSNQFLVAAAQKRIGLIICSLYKPVAVVLPVDRVTDTAIIRNLANLSSQSKRRLWGKTLDAKCYNQYVQAKEWNSDSSYLSHMLRLSNSDKDTREAETAKMYWSVFSERWCDDSFIRDKSGEGVNSLLNYAYAILLSLVLRYLLALGLDPTFGIFHQSRAHATPLAYDLMEPFRIIFDAAVADWIQKQRGNNVRYADVSFGVTTEYRRYIGNVLGCTLQYNGKESPLRNVVEAVIRSFRKAVELNQTGPYEPWKISTIKWDG